MDILDTLTGFALFALAAGIVVWRFWSGFRAGYAGDENAPSLGDVEEEAQVTQPPASVTPDGYVVHRAKSVFDPILYLEDTHTDGVNVYTKAHAGPCGTVKGKGPFAERV